MTDNFFTDNIDLQFHLEHLDIKDVIEVLEDGYRYSEQYPAAPRNYADAKDNFRLLLNVMGEVCANQIAPRAAEADEEGVQFQDGQVAYAPAIQEGLEMLRQAELMGAMLPWKYGGLNLPETVFRLPNKIQCINSRVGDTEDRFPVI